MTKSEYQDMYLIVGAAMEVHRELGRGLAEAIYQEALMMELETMGIEVEREKQLPLFYKGRKMKKLYISDFYCKGIMIELKSTNALCSEHRAQLFNYMRITGQHRGILFNFGEKFLRSERFLYLPEDDDFVLLTQDNYKDYITSEKRNGKI